MTDYLPMKVHKLEVYVFDHENLTPESLMIYFENMKYINATVGDIQSYDVIDWHDDHPLNKNGNIEILRNLFNVQGRPAQSTKE